MRPAGQAKLGYFPLHPDAVDLILGHLDAPESGRPNILDPCCGEGAALKRFADALGAHAGTHGIELDGSRAATARAAIPRGTILGPASFFATRITPHRFGLVYCNPPFDDELGGGGREEDRFLREATRMLTAGGILVLVLPERTIGSSMKLREHLACWYEDDIRAFDLPDPVRPYGEVVVIGRRRREVIPAREATRGLFGTLDWWRSDLGFPVLGTTGDRWTLPVSPPPPRWFDKTDFTERELLDALAGSPLRAHLDPPDPPAPASPPLSLGEGHIALLLASGHLNGIVRPEGETPHVVRGTARKERYLKEGPFETRDDKGNVITREVYAERIILTIRALALDGSIRTFEQ